MLRHLIEDSAQVFTERQIIPAVRSYTLKLILAGETASVHVFEYNGHSLVALSWLVTFSQYL